MLSLHPASSKASIIRGVMLIMATILLVSSLSSCDPDQDDYYDSYLYGSWSLIAINGTPVPYGGETSFYFTSGGIGYLNQYDYYGQWTEYDITWWVRNDVLYVDAGPWGEVWSYYFTVQGSYLYLTDLTTGDNLTYQYDY